MSDLITVTFVLPSGEVIAAQTDADTLMEAAVANGVPGIAADCGGACSCATCRVDVEDSWIETTGPAHEIEEELLELSDTPPTSFSRLSCQIKLNGELDGLVVTLPEE